MEPLPNHPVTPSHKIVITGFNTDIEHDGVVYHVQTEDKGLASPLILSLVYTGGAILASKRSPYQDLITAGFDEEVLSERLKKQHRLICAAIAAGRIEELKRMGARVAIEEKPAPIDLQTPDVIERFVVETVSEQRVAEGPNHELILETSAERYHPVEPQDELILETSAERYHPVEPSGELMVETSAERTSGAAEPPVVSPPPEDEDLLKPRKPTKARESAYTVYDSRRKAQKGARAEPESGLVLSILDEGEFYAGEAFTIRILLQNRSGKTEKPVSGVTVSFKILGTGFRPRIFSVKTARDGVGIVTGEIPHFNSGRAAIVIRAVLDDQSAEVRRVIHPAA